MNKRELYEALRYQVLTPRVTTMGPCARGCGTSARGSGVCKLCLSAELDQLLGTRFAAEWAIFSHNAMAAQAYLEDALDEG